MTLSLSLAPRRTRTLPPHFQRPAHSADTSPSPTPSLPPPSSTSSLPPPSPTPSLRRSAPSSLPYSPPIPPGLTGDYCNGDLSLIDLAEKHDLELRQLNAIVNSPEFRRRIDTLNMLSQQRADDLAIQARPAAIQQLILIASHNPADSTLLPPRIACNHRETTRKAINQLIRTKQIVQHAPASNHQCDALAGAHIEVDQPSAERHQSRQTGFDPSPPHAPPLEIPENPHRSTGCTCSPSAARPNHAMPPPRSRSAEDPTTRRRTSMIARITGSLALLALLLLVLSFPAGPASAEPAGSPGPDFTSPGPLGVVTVEELVLHDQARAKDLQLTVRRPERIADRGHPLVIFSHGAGGSSDAFPDLSAHLASRGYVVVHPTHSDSIKGRKRDGEHIDNLRQEIDGIVQKVDLRDRLADVQFIIDSISDIEDKLGAPGLVDTDRIALAGHSAGAMTTQAAAGLTFHPRGSRGTRGISMPIDSIDVFVIISGQGTTKTALNETSWQSCTRPMLVIAGSRDVSRVSDETPESRRHPFEYAPADGTKYLLFIEGATHSSYQGRRHAQLLGETPPDNVDAIVEITNASTLAMLDAYLRQDQAARQWLAEGPPAQPARIEFQWQTR